jgi:ribose transport system permease protein
VTELAEPKSSPAVRGAIGLLKKLGPLIGLMLVVVLFATMRPKTFPTLDNIQIILLQTAVVGTAALGATVIIISGGIDLSVGSNIALCTVVIAQMLVNNQPPWLAAIVGIAAGTGVGLLIGLLVTVLDLPPFIATLGLLAAVRGLAEGVAQDTEVIAPVTPLNNLLRILGPGEHWMLFPIGVWIMLALTIFVALVLRYTRFGRHIFAIGSNEQTARLCGVRVGRTKVLIYVFAALFAGIAGLLQFSYLTQGDPTTAKGLELDIIAAVVIGGASLNGGEGGVGGTLIGALIMTVVSNGCTKMDMPNWVQEIVTGGIIILAVTLDRLRQRRTK